MTDIDADEVGELLPEIEGELLHPENAHIIDTVIRTERSNQLSSKFFKKSHSLVFAQLHLHAREYDILALLLSRVRKEHWGMPDDPVNKKKNMEPSPVLTNLNYTFSSDVLSEWFGIEKRGLFRYLKEPAMALAAKNVIMMDDDEKKLRSTPLFKDVIYEKGLLTIIPNDRLYSQWVSLSGGFSQIPHGTFKKMKNGYAKRLYSILVRFRNKGKLHPFSISVLKELFGLVDTKGNLLEGNLSHEENGYFLKHCIRDPILIIQKFEKNIEFFQSPKSKKDFGYKKIREGRTVVGLEFLFRWLTDEEILKRDAPAPARTPYTDPLDVYKLVENFEFDRVTSPNVEELNMMIANVTDLLRENKDVGGFMQNYSVAMGCAIELEKEEEALKAKEDGKGRS